ncbi:MAG TPA: hypothetical protein VHX87_01875 [Galbitalea sp.]|nr:hypothetical protein [Galbitalea sp.]
MTAAAVALVGASLAGCSRFRGDAQPVAATTPAAIAPTSTSTADSSGSASALASIQADLDSANSSASSAASDVAAGEAAAATNDNN